MQLRATLVGAALLAATPAFAQVDNTPLACTDGPTFFPRGDHWAVTPGATDTEPIYFLQAAAGSDDITSSNAEANAVERAFLTWMNTTCDGAYPNILVQHGGDFAGTDLGAENESVIRFAESASQTAEGLWNWDSQTVAMTIVLHYADTLESVGADMVFNGVNYHWRARPGFPPSGAYQGCTASATCYDVESVALHEAGHFIGFQHVSCADAVMFPHGSGTEARIALSTHELNGICNLYPPRPTNLSTTRAFSESCLQASECPGPNNACLRSADFPSQPGYCTRTCSGNNDCPVAYSCRTPDGMSGRFCMPGPHLTGNATGGDSEGASDLCSPCTAGSQCSNGMCVDDGVTSICSQPCSTTIGCPDGFDCRQAGSSMACWPRAGTACNSTSDRAQLNDLCFAEDPNDPNNPFYAPCAPELICFGFKPRCEGQQGGCVNYCSASIGCAEGLKCCYGVTASGSCIENPGPNSQHGGCFNIRRQAESCYLMESSICESGTECFVTDGNPTSAACFALCDSRACASGSECVSGDDACFNTFSICCESESWTSDNICEPGEPDALFELGVRCSQNSDCDSNLCLRYDGDAACSRVCNPVTGVGCPGDDFDANEDGVPDGGFICRLIGTGDEPGRCWPRNGPVEPPERAGDDVPLPGGCCNASGLTPGDLIVGALAWLPLIVARLRRRQTSAR